MKRSFEIIALSGFVALACTRNATTSVAASSSQSALRSSETPVGFVPVDLRFDTPLSDREVSLQALRGRGVVVAAISVDDVHSQALVRHLERLAREHPDELAVIALVGDQSDPSSLRTLLETYQSVLHLERTTLALASTEMRAGATALGQIERVPTTYLFNRAGALVQRVVGYQSYPMLAELVAPTLMR
ncbi:MAG: hypothetical protein JNK72_09270 [Myxococcales bacterium]|nr:hypothetical protein [Myxococcales bacterium]